MPTATASTTRTALHVLRQRKILFTGLALALCLIAVWYVMYERPRSICQKAITDILSQPQLSMGYANGEQTSLDAEELTQCHAIANSLIIVRARFEGHVVPACGNICIHVESTSREEIEAYVFMDAIGVIIKGDYYECRYQLTQTMPAVGDRPFGQFLNRLHQIPDPNW